MKKLIKGFAAITSLFCLLSLVSCDMATEEELLLKAGLSPNNSISVGGGSVSGADSIGDAWGALFSDKSHNPIDLQVWQGFDATYNNTDGMVCTISGSEWFGGAIVQNHKPVPKDSVYFDMSAVKKMTFKVKASKNMTIWSSYSVTSKSDEFRKDPVNVTTDWQEVTFSKDGVKEAWSIFAFGSDGSTKGAKLYFKDVTYYDSEGKSLTLKYTK